MSSVQLPKAYRALMLIGFGLILVGFAGMNFRPYAYGDTRVFNWLAVSGIISMAGVLLLVAMAVTAIVRARRGGNERVR